MKLWKIILLTVGGLTLVVLAIGFLVLRPKNDKGEIETAVVPQFIQADFIDLDRIYTISKFRSGAGHDFSSGGETCRSMKHYFNTQDSKEKLVLFDKNNGLPPAPDGVNDINIYSPVEGKIIAVESEQIDIGKQVYLEPKSNPNYTVRLFHIYLDEGIKRGSQVSAGQKIGVIGRYQNTDIAIQAGKFRGQFISYFEAMPDNIFAKYQARGIKSRSELIITQAERDANPLRCQGEQFAKSDYSTNSNDYVFLSGYISPDR